MLSAYYWLPDYSLQSVITTVSTKVHELRNYKQRNCNIDLKGKVIFP